MRNFFRALFPACGVSPCIITQVRSASAKRAMVTATLKSAQDRHWNPGPHHNPARFGRAPPTRVTDRRDPVREDPARTRTSGVGIEPTGPKMVVLHQNMVQALQRKYTLAVERSSMVTRRERPITCLPLRSDHRGSSSVVKEPSDLENQIGRLYFRSDPVKYCKQ